MTTDKDCFAEALASWNERDATRMRGHVERAMTPDVEFCDPHYDIRGIEAFVAMVKAFQEKYPNATVVRTSVIDAHHDRARYAWAVVLADGRRLEGFDAVALDMAAGRIRRIDGFFGVLQPG
jgi:hypothetical protein